MKSFQGKVAAITGAGSGIGRALALKLTERGAVVALADVDEPGLQQTKAMVEQSGGRATIYTVDVANRAEVEAFALQCEADHGVVHLLFNNAGVALVDRIETMSYEDMEWLMGINFWGVVYGTKAFLPVLRKVDRAHVINISSIFGIIGVPTQGAYNASKFAVRGFTEALRIEMEGSNIGVSCVHPGGIRTNISNNARVAEESLQLTKQSFTSQFDRLARTTPEAAAETILRGVSRDKRRILIGADARVMDWVARLFPACYETVLRLKKLLPDS